MSQLKIHDCIVLQCQIAANEQLKIVLQRSAGLVGARRLPPARGLFSCRANSRYLPGVAPQRSEDWKSVRIFSKALHHTPLPAGRFAWHAKFPHFVVA